MDACILKEIGKWINANKNFIYEVKAGEIQAKNAIILEGKDDYYAVMKDVPMSADANVQREESMKQVWIDADIVSAEWLDNGEKIVLRDHSFSISPFLYGRSYSIRVAKLNKKKNQ